MANKKIIRQGIVPAAIALTVAANIGIDAVRLNGVSTAQISDSFPNLFVPAGYVFAVWGVIFLALIAYSIYQALPAQFANPRLHAITPLVLLSCAANVLWLVFFHYAQFGLAMIMIVSLLLLLIGCYVRLTTSQTATDASETWFARVPFSIYLAWTSVATIANATQLLVFLKWNGFGLTPEFWTVLMIAVATLLGVIMFITRRDTAFLLVLAWAFSGIGNKQSALPNVATPAWLAIGLVLLLAAATLIWRKPAVLRNLRASGVSQ